MNAFTIIFWGFIVVYLVITYFLGRRSPSLSQFYIMNQSAGPWLVAGTYAATWISAFGMVGVAGTSYDIAPLAGILMWGAMCGFVITGFVLGPRLRRFGQVTFGDFFGERFDSDAVRLISSIVAIVGLLTYFVSQTMGSAIVTNMVFGMPYNTMVIIMTAIFIFIAVAAGAQSVTITDTIMFAVIAVCLGYVFSPALIHNIGMGRISAYADANPSFFTYGGGKIAFSTIVGWQIIWALGNASMPQAVSRCFLARSNVDWMKSVLIALIVTMSAVWLTHFASGVVKIVNPNLKGTEALTWGAMNYVSPVIGGVATAGLFAAALSTATTQVLYLAFCVSRDIYEKYLLKKRGGPVDERKVLLVTRLWIVVFGVLGGALAIWRPAELIQFGNLAASIFAASFFPPLLLGLYWRRCTKEGAIAGMVLGFAVILVLNYLAFAYNVPFGNYSYLPWGLHPIYWGAGVSFLATWLVSLFTNVSEKGLQVYQLVSTPGEADAATAAEKASLWKWVYVAVAYVILQTAVIGWLATKV